MVSDKKVNIRAAIDVATHEKLKELRILYSSKANTLVTQETTVATSINDAHAFRFATRLRGKNASKSTKQQ